MLAAYSWLLRLLVPAVLLRLLLRGWRQPGYWERIPERFGFVPRRADGETPLVWIHAVSVGEVRAALPLVRALAERHPEYHVWVTTMTPTGSVTVQSLLGERVAHSYVPYDLPSAIERFLERVRPAAAVVMETEIWPNLYHRLAARGVPILMANVRLSAHSFRRYLRIKRLIAATLAKVSAFAVQSEADAARLAALGAPCERIEITGSIKFELALPASLREAAEVLRRQWGADRPIWVAGSTHEGEEATLLEAHRRLRQSGRFADALLVIVPRHPERFAAVTRLARRAGFHTALRSETRDRALDPAVAVLIGDSLGELMLFYGAADAAYIGGSLVPKGGQNLLEAAALGRPVVFGPHMFNFRDIARLALERGAAVEVRNSAALAEAIGDFLGNANRRFAAGEAGRRMLEESRGAGARTMALLERLLERGR